MSQPQPQLERSRSSSTVKKMVTNGAQLTHGTFSFAGSTDKKQYVLVEDGLSSEFTADTWKSILDTWELEKPNLLVHVSTGCGHPRNIVTPQLLATPSFKRLAEHIGVAGEPSSVPPREIFKKSASMLSRSLSLSRSAVTPQQATTTDVGGAAAANLVPADDAGLEMVNQVVYDRLTKTVEGLACAAMQTNSWILHTGIGMCGEVLMNRAMKESHISPVVLMVENLDSPWMTEYKMTEDMAAALDNNAVPLGQEPRHTVLPADIWIPGKSPCKHDDFLEHGMDWWSFKRPVGAGALGDGSETWHPHMAWPNPCNTHYIFIKSMGGEPEELAGNEPAALNLDLLAPRGGAFIASGPLSFEEGLESMLVARPTVLFQNSGMGAQELATVAEILASTDGTGGRKSPAEVWEAMVARLPAPATPGGKPTALLTRAQVVQLCDLNSARPSLFGETIRTVDPLLHTSEDVLVALSATFASRETGLVELGVGSADEDVVYDAWMRHKMLVSACDKAEMRMSLLRWASLVFTFLSTFVAVFMNHLMTEDVDEGDYWEALKLISIIMPAVLVLVTTLISQFKFDVQYAGLLVATARIVNEIYRFRARITPFSANDHATEKDADGHDVVVPAALRNKRIRALFVQRISQMVHQTMTREMALSSSGSARAFFQGAVGREGKSDMKMLREHVRAYAMPTPAPALEEESAVTADLDVVFDDDFVSKLSTQQYIQARMLPVARNLQSKTAPMAVLLRVVETLQIVVVSAGLLLSALGRQTWLPVTVSFGSQLRTFQVFTGWSGRLVSINAGLASMQDALAYYRASSIMEKQSHELTARIVASTEDAVLGEVLCRAAASGGYIGGGGGNGFESDAGDGGTSLGDDKDKKTKGEVAE
mmetsp:Transcript_780/g.2817  ORF Transcript_780/g.2817 Transcript_780/m.2817 type:complete len:881 (+) Transcript_780:162-2804(+)